MSSASRLVGLHGRQRASKCAADGQQYLVASFNEPAADCLWRWHGLALLVGEVR